MYAKTVVSLLAGGECFKYFAIVPYKILYTTHALADVPGTGVTKSLHICLGNNFGGKLPITCI